MAKADYIYEIARFLLEPSPSIDPLTLAASQATGVFCKVFFKAAEVPEINTSVSQVIFECDNLSVQEEAALDAMVSTYKNPGPQKKHEYQSSNILMISTSSALDTVWTSTALNNMQLNESAVIFVSALWNNSSSSTVSSMQWQIETGTNVWENLFANQASTASDNRASQTQGTPWTRFAVVTSKINSPRVRLLASATSGFAEITEPSVFMLKL